MTGLNQDGIMIDGETWPEVIEKINAIFPGGEIDSGDYDATRVSAELFKFPGTDNWRGKIIFNDRRRADNIPVEYFAEEQFYTGEILDSLRMEVDKLTQARRLTGEVSAAEIIDGARPGEGRVVVFTPAAGIDNIARLLSDNLPVEETGGASYIRVIMEDAPAGEGQARIDIFPINPEA